MTVSDKGEVTVRGLHAYRTGCLDPLMLLVEAVQQDEAIDQEPQEREPGHIPELILGRRVITEPSRRDRHFRKPFGIGSALRANDARLAMTPEASPCLCWRMTCLGHASNFR